MTDRTSKVQIRLMGDMAIRLAIDSSFHAEDRSEQLDGPVETGSYRVLMW
jgi:hypothetical protein